MNLLSAHDLPQDLEKLFSEARILELQDELQTVRRGQIDQTMFGRVMGTLFLEPSTRTRWSFETAFNKLGGKVVATEAGSLTTSKVKGESLDDTIQTVSQYVDFLVVRSSDPLSEWGDPVHRSLIDTRCSVINAGDGYNEHPTQAITDAYTIYEKFGRLDDLNIGVIGDLTMSRTIHSLLVLLGRSSSNQFFLWGPEKMVRDREPISPVHYEDLLNYEALAECDVLYLNRIQKERYEGRPPETIFKLDQNYLDSMKSDAIILNPGPRREEMSREFDKDPRVLYFRQAKNGLYIRMALLNWLGK